MTLPFLGINSLSAGPAIVLFPRTALWPWHLGHRTLTGSGWHSPRRTLCGPLSLWAWQIPGLKISPRHSEANEGDAN